MIWIRQLVCFNYCPSQPHCVFGECIGMEHAQHQEGGDTCNFRKPRNTDAGARTSSTITRTSSTITVEQLQPRIQREEETVAGTIIVIVKKKMKQSDVGGTHCSNGRKRSADPDESISQPPPKRCRGKQSACMSNGWKSAIENIKICKKGPGRPKGSKPSEPSDESRSKIDRDGKSICLSIWKKMEIIHEYERLKKLGTIKKVEAFMLKNGKLRGGYQGCLSQSKWLGARDKYKWDEFIKHCPKLSQKVREVPNALLDVLGVAVPRR